MEIQAIFSMKEKKSFAHNWFWELEFLITFAIVWGLFVEDLNQIFSSLSKYWSELVE